jgi:hypothetical protein
VIGVGVKNSTSDLLTANCDEFIYYDDLVRDEKKPRRAKKKTPAKGAVPKKASDEEQRRQEGLDLIVATVEDLMEERGEEEKVWGSMVKQMIKRRKPGFNESYHGFRGFSDMLLEAQKRQPAGAGARREIRWLSASSGCAASQASISTRRPSATRPSTQA